MASGYESVHDRDYSTRSDEAIEAYFRKSPTRARARAQARAAQFTENRFVWFARFGAQRQQRRKTQPLSPDQGAEQCCI
jgi:hypothetical protein